MNTLTNLQNGDPKTGVKLFIVMLVLAVASVILGHFIFGLNLSAFKN